MRRARDQTKIRHALLAIGWFSAAFAIWAPELTYERRIEAAYQKTLAEIRPAGPVRPSEASRMKQRIRISLEPTIGCDRDSDDLVPYKSLFIIAGILMFWGYKLRVGGLILGTWTAGIWILYHWFFGSNP